MQIRQGQDLYTSSEAVAGPFWSKHTIKASSFGGNTSATAKVTLMVLKAGRAIHNFKVYPSTTFGGASGSTATLSIGTAGSPTLYINAAPVNVQTASQTSGFFLQSETADTAIEAKLTVANSATSTNSTTIGMCDVWVLASRLR